MKNTYTLIQYFQIGCGSAEMKAGLRDIKQSQVSNDSCPCQILERKLIKSQERTEICYPDKQKKEK